MLPYIIYKIVYCILLNIIIILEWKVLYIFIFIVSEENVPDNLIEKLE